MSEKRKSDSSFPDGKGAKKGHWSQGLKSSMEDPDLIVESDEKIVIIKDKYPKAKHHFLILPKRNVPNLKSLTKDDVELLKYIDMKGFELAKKTDKDAKFRFGYHAVPSMSHLHLHVISQDFDSKCLKTKKHWNSFTTEYFIDSKNIIEELEENGKVETISSKESEELLKMPLRCHECKAEFPTIPKLKYHIAEHFP